MFRKIAIIIILSACLLLFSNYLNSKSTNTNYEEEYFNLEEQYYELDEKYYELYADNEQYSEYSYDLIKLYTEEVVNAFTLIDEVRSQGYIANETEFYEALNTITEFYDSVTDISADLDNVPVT